MNDIPTEGRRVAAGWFKSSYSAANNECVEVAFSVDTAGVRDSKVGAGPQLAAPVAAFAAFVEGLKEDSFGVRAER
jgi:hypothetical protein